MGKPIAMDQVNGTLNMKTKKNSASLQFNHNFGHFVTIDASGNVVLAVTDSTAIVGWAFSNDVAKSATAGTDDIPVNFAVDAEYIIPACAAGVAVSETTLKAALGKTCDIYTTSTTHQFADLATGGSDSLLVTGYQYEGSALGQQFVTVKQNPYGISGRTGV